MAGSDYGVNHRDAKVSATMPGSQVVPHHSPRGHRETAAEFAANEAQAHAMHEKMERVKSMAARRKPDKEERSGWGCSTVLRAEDAGFDRPLAWSWASVGTLAAASYYGGARYLDLLKQDVYGGVRCASCDLRPGRSFAYGGCAAAAFIVASLGVSDVLAAWSPRWIFPVDPAAPGGGLARLRSVARSSSYEFLQFLVSIAAVVSYLDGLSLVALVDEPGDPLHLHYVVGGHKHATRDHPWRRGDADDNPLGINGRAVSDFLKLEIFVLWAVGLNAVFNGLLRVTAPKTMYEPKLWVALDLIDLGCVLGVAYPRILEAEGYAGTRVGGYSMFILFGVFRFLRGLRFERFVLMRYGYVGVPSLRLNGVYVRFITLLFKMIFIVLSMGALISCAEYPCGPNAVRHDRLEELGNCNIAFRSYDRCIYFLIVTFSTVGYGDMYPATQVGRFVIIVILVFVLCFLPDLLGDIAELSDGDDMSNDDKIIASVGAAWEEIVQCHHKVDHLAGALDAIAGVAKAAGLARSPRDGAAKGGGGDGTAAAAAAAAEAKATGDELRGALRDGFAAVRSDAEYALDALRDIQRRLAVLEDAAHEGPPAYAPARPSPRAPAAARDEPAAPESPELPARPPPSAAPHPALASPFALPLPWYFAPPPDGDADRFREPLRARRRSPRSKRKPARDDRPLRPLPRSARGEDRGYYLKLPADAAEA
jgi:hypothetical protein